MKKVLILIIAIVGCLLGCSKLNDKAIMPLTGKWMWQKSVGGINGNSEISPQVGETRVLEFFKDSTYTLTQNGATPISYTNRFSIVSVNDISTHEQRIAVILYDETLRPQLPMIIELNNDQLKLRDNYVDGYSHYYISVN